MRTRAPRNPREEDFRCRACRILLATIDENGLTLCRGGLQATVAGDFHVSIVCYRPRCRTLNVLRVRTRAAESESTA